MPVSGVKYSAASSPMSFDVVVADECDGDRAVALRHGLVALVVVQRPRRRPHRRRRRRPSCRWRQFRCCHRRAGVAVVVVAAAGGRDHGQQCSQQRQQLEPTRQTGSAWSIPHSCSLLVMWTWRGASRNAPTCGDIVGLHVGFAVRSSTPVLENIKACLNQHVVSRLRVPPKVAILVPGSHVQPLGLDQGAPVPM